MNALKTVDELLGYEDSESIFGFGTSAICCFLSYDDAPQNYKKGLSPEEIKEINDGTQEPTRDNVLSAMRGYMVFAWNKVEDHRGLSTIRSIEKMRAWLWILGDDGMIAITNDESLYPNYGAPILKRICEKYDFEIPDDADIVLMADGKPCTNNGCTGCVR